MPEATLETSDASSAVLLSLHPSLHTAVTTNVMVEFYFTDRFAVACKASFNRQHRLVVDWRRRRTPSELIDRESDLAATPIWPAFPTAFVEETLEKLLPCGPLEATLITADAAASVTWLPDLIRDAFSGAVRGNHRPMEALRTRCAEYSGARLAKH